LSIEKNLLKYELSNEVLLWFRLTYPALSQQWHLWLLWTCRRESESRAWLWFRCGIVSVNDK